jgi:signal transduction histidine kinase/ActR/RegA family two-component response regulator
MMEAPEDPQDSQSWERSIPFGVSISLAVLDRATRIARSLVEGADATVALVKDGRMWRSRDGAQPQVHKITDNAAISLVLASGEAHWIEDLRLDPRLADHPMVAGPPFLRGYVGVPVRLEDGTIPAVLSLGSKAPIPFNRSSLARLKDLGDFVADELARAKAAEAYDQLARDLDDSRTSIMDLVSAVPMSVVLTDRQMKVMAVSREWSASEKIEAHLALGQSLYELNPTMYEPGREVFEQCLAGHSFRHPRLFVPRPGDTPSWIQCDISPWRNSRGDVIGLMISANDVSEIVDLLRHSKRSEERLNAALEVTEITVMDIDYGRGELVMAGAGDRFFDPPETFQSISSDPLAHIDPRDVGAVKDAMRRRAKDGTPFSAEYRLNRRDGREIWVQASVRDTVDARGAARSLCAMKNITRHKQAEATLLLAKQDAEAANLAKSTFLATMSHEIRTPLNGVLGMAQAMAADDLTDAQRARVQVIRQSGEALLAILNDVLDLSKIEAGKVTLEAIAFDVEALVQAVHATFGAVAQAKGLTFEARVSPAARGGYLGDPVRLRQIIGNLVSNALKFTDEGRVALEVDQVDGRLAITVSDSGIGIEPREVEVLFEKFKQADATTTRRFGGTGLGLAICRDLAALMGGSITAGPGAQRGSVFTVILPLARVDAPLTPPVEPRAGVIERETGGVGAVRPLRILAAEDNGVNQLVLKTLLGQAGLDVTVVADGRAAVDAWRGEAWDLILMDIQMPVMDGLAATAEIRAAEAAQGLTRTPIVALSANAMAHQVADYAQQGMDGFIAKPIEVARLFAAIEAALEEGVEAGGERIDLPAAASF